MGGKVPPRHGAPSIGGTLGYPMAPAVGGCIQRLGPPIPGRGPSRPETMCLSFRIKYKDKESLKAIYCTTISSL